MATQSSDIVLDVAAISARLLEAQEIAPRAVTIAKAITSLLPGTAANVYLISDTAEGKVWSVRATVGDAVPDKTVSLEAGALGILGREGKVLSLSGQNLKREEFAHLNVRKTVHSLACAPLVTGKSIIGAIEVVGFEEAFSDAQIQSLAVIASLAAPALIAAQTYEEERHNSLTSVSRLTQFYDIEKVFHSTLEMEQLLPMMGAKICEVLECQAVNIWLLEGDESLKLMHQAGIDPTVQEGMHQRPGEGVAGDTSDSGEAVLIADPDDERLVKRNQAVEEGGLESLLVVPLIDDGALVGVIEAANRLDGAPLDEDDLFVLTNLCETASSALHNASLLLAERKVEILETLVTVSHEITSTLNLERMLQTIVNASQAIIPFERAAIGLEQHGKYRLSAVTGVTQLDPNAPEVASINDILRWAILSEEVVHVKQHGDEISDAREETQAKFRSYFQETGMRGFYAVPLSDDTGRVGILGMESSDPDFLSSAHLEILQVLAGQATVALRNAQMYKEVPFISVLEPVLERKRKFMAMEKRRRTAMLLLAAATVIFLVVAPLPLRVDGDAVVAPARAAQIQPEVEGVVSRVLVREGEHVAKGQVIAELEDWDYRSALGQAEAKYQTTQLQMNRALATNDGSEAGVQRVQADYWKGEVERMRQLLERTQLRSPIEGVVATAHVEDMAGRRLQFGDSLAEVVDTSHAVVDVAIDDTDASLLRAGAHSVVKLNSYPTRTFRGVVGVVSPIGTLQGESRVFFARVSIPNSDNAVRAGMEGRGKVSVGWYPAGYVIFRHAGIWLYQHIWSWFGW